MTHTIIYRLSIFRLLFIRKISGTESFYSREGPAVDAGPAFCFSRITVRRSYRIGYKGNGRVETSKPRTAHSRILLHFFCFASTIHFHPLPLPCCLSSITLIPSTAFHPSLSHRLLPLINHSHTVYCLSSITLTPSTASHQSLSYRLLPPIRHPHTVYCLSSNLHHDDCRFASMLPAVLLTMLFYLDQNISVRAVNACNLKKVRFVMAPLHCYTYAHTHAHE